MLADCGQQHLTSIGFALALVDTRGVARGGAGGPIWQISQPYSNQGADYAPHTAASPLGFKNYLHLWIRFCYKGNLLKGIDRKTVKRLFSKCKLETIYGQHC